MIWLEAEYRTFTTYGTYAEARLMILHLPPASFADMSDTGGWIPGPFRAYPKKGSGTVVRSTLRAVPATVPDPFFG